MEKVKKLIKSWQNQSTLKKSWILGVGLFIALVEVRSCLDKSLAEKTRVLAAKRKLVPGIRLGVQDLTVTLVNSREDIVSQMFSEDSLHRVLGRELILSLPPGSPLTRLHLADTVEPQLAKKIPKGYRAHAIKFNHQLPIESGDRVDISGSMSSGQKVRELFIEDRKVIGIKHDENSSEVLLAVRAAEVQELDPFEKSGNIHLLLRNPKDESRTQSKEEPAHPKRITKKVEVWEES